MFDAFGVGSCKTKISLVICSRVGMDMRLILVLSVVWTGMEIILVIDTTTIGLLGCSTMFDCHVDLLHRVRPFTPVSHRLTQLVNSSPSVGHPLALSPKP